MRKNGVQESTDTHKHKSAEIMESDMYHEWRMQHLPLDVMVGNRGAKANVKSLQVGQERKLLEKIVWVGVCGWVDPGKYELDKAGGS